MNQTNSIDIEKKRAKAKELLGISLKVHNELRPYFTLGSKRKLLGKISCQQGQETMLNIFTGNNVEEDIAAEAIDHTAGCEKCLEVLDIVIWE